MTDLETTAHAIYVAYHTALGRPVKSWAALTDADRARHRQRAEAFLTPDNARKPLPERLYLAWWRDFIDAGWAHDFQHVRPTIRYFWGMAAGIFLIYWREEQVAA